MPDGVAELERLLLRLIPSTPFRGLAFAVGGCVRDSLLGLPMKDFDAVVERAGGAKDLCIWLHETFNSESSRPHELGAGYPIWQIAFKDDVAIDGDLFHVEGTTLEVADTQSESFPDPATRARVTVFGDLAADCRRRDFTVNMLYRDLSTGELRDLSGHGLQDLRDGILQGHPDVDLGKIFRDDPLRMIRLVRFHCRFGWRIPASVKAKVKAEAPRMKILSAERIRNELIKIMEMGKLSTALRLLQELELLPHLFPELLPMIGCTQDTIYHSEGDVWVHTLMVVDKSPPTVTLQLAALLHDLGKPPTRSEHGERVKFLGHELVSVDLARPLLSRLRIDSGTTEKVLRLIALHLRGGDVSHWTTLKPARKLLRDAGEDLVDLLALIEADSSSSHGRDGCPRLEHVALLHEKLRQAQVIPIQKRSVLSGREVMSLLGLNTGPQVGEAMRYLQDCEDELAERGEVLDEVKARSLLKAKFGDLNNP